MTDAPENPAAALETEPEERIGPYLAELFEELATELDAVIPRVTPAKKAPAKSGQMDTEAVHDLRVVLRRIRTLMKLARPVYGRFYSDSVRRAFADAMKATGELRDEEVLEETLGALHVAHGSFATFKRQRALREKRLRRAMVDNVRSGHIDQAQAMLRALITLPVRPSRNVLLSKFAKRAVARAVAEVLRQKSAPTDDVSLLHELRIAYKELRYTCELFAPALPAEITERADIVIAPKMQKRLGEVHDLDVAILTIARARTLPLIARSAALAELDALRDKKVQKYIAENAPPKTAGKETSPEAKAPEDVETA